jgi:hypothetical protein
VIENDCHHNCENDTDNGTQDIHGQAYPRFTY